MGMSEKICRKTLAQDVFDRRCVFAIFLWPWPVTLTYDLTRSTSDQQVKKAKKQKNRNACRYNNV